MNGNNLIMDKKLISLECSPVLLSSAAVVILINILILHNLCNINFCDSLGPACQLPHLSFMWVLTFCEKSLSSRP